MSLSICRTALLIASLQASSLTPSSASATDVKFNAARVDTATFHASAPPSFLTDSVQRSFAIPTGVLGVTIGAAVGGVAGGALSRGSCEQSRCNNVGRDALGGALIGAGVGLLIELAIRYSPFRR